jgi:hypothetical protein
MIIGCTASPDPGRTPVPVPDAAREDMGDPALDADACEHMVEGPSEELPAFRDGRFVNKAVEPGHVRWDIRVAVVYHCDDMECPTTPGVAKLSIEEPGKIAIYEHQEGGAMTLLDTSGDEVIAEATNGNVTGCTEPMARRTFALGAGSYRLSFSSLEWSRAKLVVLMADDVGH